MKRKADDLQSELEKKFDELFGHANSNLDSANDDTEKQEDSEDEVWDPLSDVEENVEDYDLPQEIKNIIDKGDFSEDQIRYIRKIPWHQLAIPSIDIENAKNVLQQSHYGMFDVKERILRYIACQKHLGKAYGAILILVGPPGVGKTSIVKSIAKALGREFVKISLAGMYDADPLRGYDRNYKQAKPGEIVNAIIKAESFCPLILLDEIDKMGSSIQRGDPAHVLLDILDSDRTHFTDNMIDIPIDLSNIIFVATANNVENISPILLDRLEIIKLKGYTNQEKCYIAQNYLLPSLLREYHIDDLNIEFSYEFIEYIVENHTSEPGIRSLERYLRTICETVISYKYMTNQVPRLIDLSVARKITNETYFKSDKLTTTNEIIHHNRGKRKNRRKKRKMYNIEV